MMLPWMKNNNVLQVVICLVLSFVSIQALSQISQIDASSGDSYYYIDHFETVIDKPADEVWPHVIEMGKWMPWMANDESKAGKISEHDRVHLYGDYYVEVVKIVPQKLIILANLPAEDEGGESQGVAMISTSEFKGKTLVSIFMSRIYYWFEDEPDPLRATRESSDFSSNRKVTFQGNFLAKLKQLAEAQGS